MCKVRNYPNLTYTVSVFVLCNIYSVKSTNLNAFLALHNDHYYSYSEKYSFENFRRYPLLLCASVTEPSLFRPNRNVFAAYDENRVKPDNGGVAKAYDVVKKIKWTVRRRFRRFSILVWKFNGVVFIYTT